MSRIPADYLRALRNEVSVCELIHDLRIPFEMRGSRFTFQCPVCQRFHTSVLWRANLVRCFLCEKNFNPIDLAMAEKGWTFLETVNYLEGIRRTARVKARTYRDTCRKEGLFEDG